MKPSDYASVTCPRCPLGTSVYSNAGALSLREKCSGTKLENTSLSADIFQEPVYGLHNMYNSVPAKDGFAIAHDHSAYKRRDYCENRFYYYYGVWRVLCRLQ